MSGGREGRLDAVTPRFEFDEQHNLVRFHFPRYLFRYLRADSNLLNCLRESYLWFSSPTSFNDPFDCRDIWELDNTPDELRQYVKKYSAKFVGVENFEKFFDRLDGHLEVLRQAFQSLHNFKLEQVSICCFSAVGDNNVMWSHYADGHRGACLVFDTLALMGFPISRFSIVGATYSDITPRWNQIRERLAYGDSARFNLRFGATVLGTKTLDWAYEHEVRLISHTRGVNHFPPDALIGVIRGLRMSDSYKGILETEIRGRYERCEVTDAAPVEPAGAGLWIGPFENEVRSLDVAGWRLLP